VILHAFIVDRAGFAELSTLVSRQQHSHPLSRQIETLLVHEFKQTAP